MLDIFLSFWSVGTSEGHMSIAAPTESHHQPGDTVLETGVTLMERPRIMMTSYSVTVVSPHGMWNVWVSGRHRSTSVINAAESIIGRPPVMRRASDRNPTRCMNGAYRSSHIKGLCVRILTGDSRCGTQQ
jgi:hypothetical protein